MIQDRRWVDDAACSGVPTEMFFIEKGSGTSREAQMAIQLCQTCSVQSECLEDALIAESDFAGGRHGIWGGLVPVERTRIWAERTGRIGLRSSACPEGHPMSDENAVFCGGYWQCLQCRADKRERIFAEATSG